MNDKQTNRLTAKKANMKFMDDNSTVYAGNTKMIGLVTAIKGNITTIETQAAIQSQNTTGATDTQNTKWRLAAKDATHVSTGLKGYFLDIDDETQYKLVDYTFTDFFNVKKAKALSRMTTVHDIADGITIGLLADFHIVASDITDLASSMAAFSAAEPVKRNMVEVTSGATKLIAQTFTIMDTKYKKLDLLVDGMKETHPEFVTGYHMTNKIIDLGKGHKTASLQMAINSIETIFYNQFEVGYYFTVRNNSDVDIWIGLSSAKNQAPETDLIKVLAKSELVVKLPKSALGFTTRYFCVMNQSKIYTANVVVIMSKTASASGTGEVELSGIPK
ncbi:MAG: hypothetical protein WCK29_04020 [archaeon]